MGVGQRDRDASDCRSYLLGAFWPGQQQCAAQPCGHGSSACCQSFARYCNSCPRRPEDGAAPRRAVVDRQQGAAPCPAGGAVLADRRGTDLAGRDLCLDPVSERCAILVLGPGARNDRKFGFALQGLLRRKTERRARRNAHYGERSQDRTRPDKSAVARLSGCLCRSNRGP